MSKIRCMACIPEPNSLQTRKKLCKKVCNS